MMVHPQFVPAFSTDHSEVTVTKVGKHGHKVVRGIRLSASEQNIIRFDVLVYPFIRRTVNTVIS
jgi:hypothetical protein